MQRPDVEEPKHQPIGAKRANKTRKEMGQANDIDKTVNCATNQMIAKGQVIKLKEIGLNLASQAHLGRGSQMNE